MRWNIHIVTLMMLMIYTYVDADANEVIYVYIFADAYEVEAVHKNICICLSHSPFSIRLWFCFIMKLCKKNVKSYLQCVKDISFNKSTFSGNAWDHLQDDGHFAQKTRSMTSSQELWYIFIYSQNKQNLTNGFERLIYLWYPVTINCKCCNEE